jgi:hypothetical protein
VQAERVAGIEHGLDGVDAMAFLAVHHVLAGENQIVQHAVGVGP